MGKLLLFKPRKVKDVPEPPVRMFSEKEIAGMEAEILKEIDELASGLDSEDDHDVT